MSKVTQDSNIDRLKTPEEQVRFVSVLADQVTHLLNNGLLFSDNFDAKFVNANFVFTNTDLKVPHGLGRVPSGYIISRSSANMVVYDGVQGWTSGQIYLRSSAAGTVTLLLF